MLDVEVRGEYITLGQLIKLLGEVGSGSDVKTYLAENDVQVNGSREERRGRKLHPGDDVNLPGGRVIRLKEQEQSKPSLSELQIPCKEAGDG